MRRSGGVKILIIVIILAAIVLGYFYYLGHRDRKQTEEAAAATVVQSVLMRDLERNYPPTPKEVVKYYSEITECFYNEEYSDEELVQLANQIQRLYDAELVANKTQEQYMQDLRNEIAQMRQNKYTIASYEVSASTDVKEFTQDGDSCASLYCTYYIRQPSSGTRVASMEQFVLRKDPDGHWKILGWELVED